jgi:hypothetical protein
VPESSAQRQRLNPTAVLAVVLGGLISPMALPIGWFAREQIKRSGERGRGLCTVAMSLGAFATMGWIIGGVMFSLWYVSL